MKRAILCRTVVLLAAGVLLGGAALGSPGAAVATPPTSVTETISGSNVLTELCPFDVTLNFRLKVTVRTFYDIAGDPVRVQAKRAFVGTLINAETGKSLVDRDHWTTIDDLQQGTTTLVGLVFHINVPGQGIVVISAGKVVFDSETGEILFEAGPHNAEAGIDAVCAYLADP